MLGCVKCSAECFYSAGSRGNPHVSSQEQRAVIVQIADDAGVARPERELNIKPVHPCACQIHGEHHVRHQKPACFFVRVSCLPVPLPFCLLFHFLHIHVSLSVSPVRYPSPSLPFPPPPAPPPTSAPISPHCPSSVASIPCSAFLVLPSPSLSLSNSLVLLPPPSPIPPGYRSPSLTSLLASSCACQMLACSCS